MPCSDLDSVPSAMLEAPHQRDPIILRVRTRCAGRRRTGRRRGMQPPPAERVYSPRRVVVEDHPQRSRRDVDDVACNWQPRVAEPEDPTQNEARILSKLDLISAISNLRFTCDGHEPFRLGAVGVPVEIAVDSRISKTGRAQKILHLLAGVNPVPELECAYPTIPDQRQSVPDARPVVDNLVPLHEQVAVRQFGGCGGLERPREPLLAYHLEHEHAPLLEIFLHELEYLQVIGLVVEVPKRREDVEDEIERHGAANRRMSSWTNSTARFASAAQARALSRRKEVRSTAVTTKPRLARATVWRPGPQQRSRARPFCTPARRMTFSTCSSAAAKTDAGNWNG